MPGTGLVTAEVVPEQEDEQHGTVYEDNWCQVPEEQGKAGQEWRTRSEGLGGEFERKPALQGQHHKKRAHVQLLEINLQRRKRAPAHVHDQSCKQDVHMRMCTIGMLIEWARRAQCAY